MLEQLILGYPVATFGLLLGALALPFLPAMHTRTDQPRPAWLRWYQGSAVILMIALAATAATRYLLAARPVIEGVDFFYYVCIARDYFNGVIDGTLAKYAYFPGGYRYWELVMALFGDDLPTLQFAVIGTLVANAALCGLIVARAVKSLAAGVVAALWYLALASRFEALDGTTEPIATLFALAGVFFWAGMPLRGTDGWRRAILLGAGLGLAVWTKQQGGLVAVGAAILALNYGLNRAEARDSAWQLLALPVAATCVLLIALLLEGHGLAPLRLGLGAVENYEVHGSFSANLPLLARQTGITAWLVLLVLFFWIAMLGSRLVSGARQDPWEAIVGFSLIAALATLAQFGKRSYFHYALLAAPFLAIAVVSMAARAAQSACAAWPRMRPVIAIATAGLLAVPIVGSTSTSGFFHVWPVEWNPVVAHGRPWRQTPGVAADLQTLAGLIAAGEDVLIVPPRRNVIHFVLGSRPISSPTGYGWGAHDASKAIRSASLAAVLVLDRGTFDDADSATCKLIDCDRAVASLEENGFRRATSLKAMTLWRREARDASGPGRTGPLSH